MTDDPDWVIWCSSLIWNILAPSTNSPDTVRRRGLTPCSRLHRPDRQPLSVLHSFSFLCYHVLSWVSLFTWILLYWLWVWKETLSLVSDQWTSRSWTYYVHWLSLQPWQVVPWRVLGSDPDTFRLHPLDINEVPDVQADGCYPRPCRSCETNSTS